jgi:hypothetical protein
MRFGCSTNTIIGTRIRVTTSVRTGSGARVNPSPSWKDDERAAQLVLQHPLIEPGYLG